MCAFSTSLTTTVFSQRSMWRFETVPHRTIPEGQQSSIFHRALIPPSDCLPTTRFLIRGALKGAINMPHYLISVWHDETFELDFSTPDAQRRVAQVDAFNNELQQAGAWVFATGLHPASSATVVRSSGGDVSMTDGPYAETKEQMGGFWVIDATDLDEDAVAEAFAIAAERWPNTGIPPNPGGWITTTARNRAIDRLRRESTRSERHLEAHRLHTDSMDPDHDPELDRLDDFVDVVPDDQLPLMFQYSHPALAAAAH